MKHEKDMKKLALKLLATLEDNRWLLTAFIEQNENEENPFLRQQAEETRKYLPEYDALIEETKKQIQS